MARHLATIGRLTIWLEEGMVATIPPEIRLVANYKQARLSLDQSVELARLLIKTAAQHGWGSEEDKERLIAWASIKK